MNIANLSIFRIILYNLAKSYGEVFVFVLFLKIAGLIFKHKLNFWCYGYFFLIASVFRKH